MTEASPLPMSQPISVAELLVDPAGVPRARAMLQRAEWAERAFAQYDKASVDAIVRAAAVVGAAKAREYAGLDVRWPLRETSGCRVPCPAEAPSHAANRGSVRLRVRAGR